MRKTTLLDDILLNLLSTSDVDKLSKGLPCMIYVNDRLMVHAPGSKFKNIYIAAVRIVARLPIVLLKDTVLLLEKLRY